MGILWHSQKTNAPVPEPCALSGSLGIIFLVTVFILFCSFSFVFWIFVITAFNSVTFTLTKIVSTALIMMFCVGYIGRKADERRLQQLGRKLRNEQ